jgi:hypothetical protein
MSLQLVRNNINQPTTFITIKTLLKKQESVQVLSLSRKITLTSWVLIRPRKEEKIHLQTNKRRDPRKKPKDQL